MATRKSKSLRAISNKKLIGLPILLGENTFKWHEMMVASSITISLRMLGIWQRTKDNRMPDTRELQRMVSEKQSAMVTASAAIIRWQQQLLTQASQLALPPLISSKSTSLNPNFFWSLLGVNMQFSHTMLNGFSKFLTPYHQASTANATRLTRRKHL